MDYEKKFKELCKQIHEKAEWARKVRDEDSETEPKSALKDLCVAGMVYAYESIENLTNELEVGSFEL